uniref:Protein IMPACT n=3 Tax=Panthera TaxID=9688 RepID=A0A8C9JPD8_PANTA
MRAARRAPGCGSGSASPQPGRRRARPASDGVVVNHQHATEQLRAGDRNPGSAFCPVAAGSPWTSHLSPVSAFAKWAIITQTLEFLEGPLDLTPLDSELSLNEEIEAMAAIYGEEWCVIDDCAKIFCIRISDDIDDPKWTLCLQVMLPNEYPGTAPPIYQLNAPWLKGQERADLSNSLEEIYIQNIGESILYLWVEKIRDVLIQKSQMTEPGPDIKKKTEEEDVECEDDLILACQPENPVKALDFEISENQTEIEELPPIDHGIPITDRRSTFQAHLAPVVCPKQVKMVLAKLYENKKIASATHNIYAYRIYCEDKQTFLQDCEDDGETAAGGRLLHLMEILNVRNVMVVVSRWYGGILLGPDRFKHINNCARNILVERNYTNSPEESSKALGKNKKVKKDKKRSEH